MNLQKRYVACSLAYLNCHLQSDPGHKTLFVQLGVFEVGGCRTLISIVLTSKQNSLFVRQLTDINYGY